MKKTFVKLLALSFALVMAIPIFASCKKEQAKIQAASHLIIDINPSLSLSLDKKNRVVSVHASNEDAQVMLYGEQLIGLKVEAALEKIAQLSLDLNYINDDNHGISVVVSGKLGENEVISTLKSVYDKQAGKLEINFTTDGNFSDLRELEALKAQFAQNLEVQKLTIKEYSGKHLLFGIWPFVFWINAHVTTLKAIAITNNSSKNSIFNIYYLL